MFFVIYLFAGERLLQKLSQLLARFAGQPAPEGTNKIDVWASTFRMVMEVENQRIKFACEDYNQSLDCEITLDLLSNEPWEYELCELCNRLVEFGVINMFVLAQGERPVVIKTDNDIVVDKSYGSSLFPWEKLRFSYEVK